MRLIWYLGKGGVGKTTVALATALRSAELGYKTLVASTSLTPSLADVLDAQLGDEPHQVAENLWAQDMSVVTDLQQRRGILKCSLAELLGSARGNEEVPGDSPVFPGLNEIVSLLHINKLVTEGNFERIIIDTAPTGETLRLLTLPDAFRWGVDRLSELNGGAGWMLQSLTGGLVRSPADLAHAVSVLDKTAVRLQNTLSDPDFSSYRILATPDKMAVREAQRALTYLRLFNYPVDSIILNRVLPRSATGEKCLHDRQVRQAKYLSVIEQTFRPLPVWHVPDYADMEEGLAALSQLARDCFGDEDPGAIFHQGVSQELVQQDGKYLLRIPLPFVKGDEVRLRKRGDQLFMTVGNFKRTIILPAVLLKQKSEGGRLVKGMIEIRFVGG